MVKKAVTSVGVRDLSPDLFANEPLLIRGVFAQSRATMRWTLSELRNRYGNLICDVSVDSVVRNDRFPASLSLREILRDVNGFEAVPAHHYFFHTFLRMDAEKRDNEQRRLECELMLDAPWPAALSVLGSTSWHRFYLGGFQSGSSPHAHGHAVNALIEGRKRWIFGSDEWEGTQESGDLVYVPGGLTHAVWNETATVGIAAEFQT
jgi:hypothetical protein